MPTVGKPGGPVAERRMCSVLFCDGAIHPVVGVAGPGGGTGAGVWGFRGGADGVGRSGGMVEKVIGYAVPSVTTGVPQTAITVSA